MIVPIKEENVSDLKDWFINYVKTFKYNDSEVQQNIDLKEKHTMRVCNEIINIGKELKLNDHELRLAEIIALLHDVGRFEQYARYRTFADRKSEDHAVLGIRVLEEQGVLKQFEDEIKNIILFSVKNHNQALIAHNESEACIFFARLIRDADKLDILKVVTDYYHRKDNTKNGTLELDLPDTPGFSEKVYRDLMNKKIVNMKNLNNLNDFKLLQVGWMFDINFQPTLDCIKERRYLELIRGVLPESKKIDEIFDIIDAS